ncbi:ABC transporter permease [Pedobacter faecalis]|uniref:ABC transporter permease n=1 Tax=Pedobacter faecalis TaxID=3041495 RepID=UPI00254D0C47|nr:ABC transporter permease [Pedobacter sp. ELA7]
MLRNYYKIAIAVLKRRKFFTFISLFGISLTLTVLMVTTAFMDKIFSPAYPDVKRGRSLFITKGSLTNTKEGWYNGSSVSFDFLYHYVTKLKTPEKVSIFTFSSSTNAYVNNRKLSIEYKFTDGAFWEVAEFKFLEGRSYTEPAVERADRVAVITARTRKRYFGDDAAVAGKYIELDNVNYRVIGVVADLPRSNRNYYSDVYLPYTVSKIDYRRVGQPGINKISLVDRYLGGFGAVMVARSESEVPKMRQEFKQMLARSFKPDTEYDKLYIHADTPFEEFSRNIFGNDESTGLAATIGAGILVVLLFLLLPAINLVNVNITRIMERSSEIGVRKAFGASSKMLVYQFLVENVILTLIGGLIGLVLSAISIYFFNQSSLLPDLDLALNWTVLGAGLLLCLLFGLLSGVYPAWRMSRFNVVHALKSQ